VLWQPPRDGKLPSSNIRALLVARDSTLWVSTTKGLASLKDGKLTNYADVAGHIVIPLLQDREGTIWFGVYEPGRLCAVRHGNVECYGAGSFGRAVLSLYEDRQGNLWVSAETGVWRWTPGPPQQYSSSPPSVETNAFVEGDDGALLLATSDGLKQLVGDEMRSYTPPDVAAQFRPNRLLRTRDGSLWIGTHEGLWHVHRGRTDQFGAVDGLSGSFISQVFQDREGTVWIATLDGLDRFREVAIPTISLSKASRALMCSPSRRPATEVFGSARHKA